MAVDVNVAEEIGIAGPHGGKHVIQNDSHRQTHMLVCGAFIIGTLCKTLY